MSWPAVIGIVLCFGIAATVLYFRHSTTRAPARFGAHAVTRRLSEEQYRNIIADVFGADIVVGGRFEPELRKDGLLSIGESQVSISQAGLEQYRAVALSVASQVTDQNHRGLLLPCKPRSEHAADQACALQIISAVGPYLYRRTLSPEETNALVGVAVDAASRLNDFYAGVEIGLADMLLSPDFLFRTETVEPDPDVPGGFRLDAFSKASRLSFFLWNSAPDKALLTAAERGELNSASGLRRQVDRMLASERLASGVRAFFVDMLGFDDFATLAKDPLIYPKFSAKAAADVPEQTLRTIVDHLLVQRGDYRDLFTTRKTFLTRTLGALYGIPVDDNVPNGFPSRWIDYEFPAGDPRAGILAQASFVSLHSHPGRSSPTLRGRAMRELLLCQKIPDPPGDVDFSLFNDPNSPHKTARERLTAHRSAPACAGCHKLMDPIGLGLEHFDSAGGFRETENGAPIDTSGELDGVHYSDAATLGKAVHDDPATTSCVVNRMYAYATGQEVPRDARVFLKELEQNFAAKGYRVPDLMRQIATSASFYQVAATPMVASTGPAQSFERGTVR
jgi:hypothetical protein